MKFKTSVSNTCATSTNFLCFSSSTLVSCESSPSRIWVFNKASSNSPNHSTAWEEKKQPLQPLRNYRPTSKSLSIWISSSDLWSIFLTLEELNHLQHLKSPDINHVLTPIKHNQTHQTLFTFSWFTRSAVPVMKNH